MQRWSFAKQCCCEQWKTADSEVVVNHAGALPRQLPEYHDAVPRTAQCLAATVCHTCI